MFNSNPANPNVPQRVYRDKYREIRNAAINRDSEWKRKQARRFVESDWDVFRRAMEYNTNPLYADFEEEKRDLSREEEREKRNFNEWVKQFTSSQTFVSPPVLPPPPTPPPPPPPLMPPSEIPATFAERILYPWKGYKFSDLGITIEDINKNSMVIGSTRYPNTGPGHINPPPNMPASIFREMWHYYVNGVLI